MELYTTPLLDMLGFCIQKRLRYFLCLTCKNCCTSDSVVTHAKQHYEPSSLPTTYGTLQQTSDLVKALGLKENININLQQTLKGVHIAYQGLPIQEGLQCTMDNCTFICGVDTGTMANHYSEHHNRSGVTVSQCTHKIPAQQVSKPCKTSYFAVHPIIYPAMSISARFKEIYGQASTIPISFTPTSDEHNRDVPPLLHHTGFHTFMKEWHDDPQLRSDVAQFCKGPGTNTSGPLAFLNDLVFKYFQDNRNIARNMDSRILEVFKRCPM